MRYVSALVAVVVFFPCAAFACHPVLKCVEPSGSGYIAYFGFEGGESTLAIGSSNKFSGATGCSSLGKNCGQGTHFPNNGPFEADLFGSDSIVPGKSLLPVAFTSSVTWTLSSSSVTATSSSKACATPTPTVTATRTSTPANTATATPSATATVTPTITATRTPTVTATSTATNTPTHTATRTSTPTVTATRTSPPLPTSTATPEPTFTATPEATATLQVTATPQPSSTPALPTPTPTATPTGNIEITDCAGVPGGSSVVDCCGVCGGDGTSCPELCKEIDNTKIKKQLRREVKRISDTISQRIKQELKCDPRSNAAKRRRVDTLSLKRQIQTLIGGYDDYIKLCDTPFCQKSSYVELSKDLELSVKKLVKIDKLSQRGAINACCAGGSCGAGRPGPKLGSKMKTIIGDLPEQKCD